MLTHKSRLLVLRPDQRKQWAGTPTEQVIKSPRTEIHLFTDIEQRLVKLFVNTPENVKVKHKETTDTSIFVSLVNFWRFTWKREKKQPEISPALKNNLKETSLLWKKKQLTNFGFNTCKYGANVEGKLLSKGTVFGNCYSLPRIIKSLFDTGLLQIIWIMFIILSSQKPLLNTNIIIN